MFAWLRRRRRNKILETPFPDEWRTILHRRFPQYRHLNSDEQGRLEQMVQVFVAEKNFEALGGLTLSDEMRVLIAGQACLLILEHSHDLYRKVDSILIYPSTVVRPERLFGDRYSNGTPLKGDSPLLGEAHLGGPVILAWDATKHGAVHPGDGRNVVFHEFAHKLDMLDGAADGVPPLAENHAYGTWQEVCQKEYDTLVNRSERGLKSFLDAYGATHPAEFFAVATEHFFEQPVRMKQRHKALYDILNGFYKQDPATRK